MGKGDGEISRKRVSDLLLVTECSNRQRNARIGNRMLKSAMECSQINDSWLIDDGVLSNLRRLGYF